MTEIESSPQIPAPPAPPPAAGAGPWMRRALIASLTVNLLVLGVVVGGAINVARHGPRQMIADITLGTFTEALSAEDREALRMAAEAENLGLREMNRAAREDYLRLIAAVRSEPWDAATAQAAIAAYGMRTHDRLEAGERLMLQRLSAMGPQGRREFADRLEETMRRGFRGERPLRPRGN